MVVEGRNSGAGSRPPAPLAEAMEIFSRFPSPLALVDASGAVLLANVAFSARYDGAAPDPGSLPAGSEAVGWRGRVALRLPGSATLVEAPARAVEIAGRFLLVFDDPGEVLRPGEFDRLRERVAELERLAATDHLTGAWNRSHFDRVIAAELSRSREGRTPVSLVLLDIDHFKRINDTRGHGMGDAVLRELVRLVQSRIRPSDVLFRWGGEEFAVLLAGAGYRGAERAAENLRAAVAAHAFRDAGTVTVSAGVAEHLDEERPQAWFARLDEALYAAKRAGRDRVVVDRRGDSDAWAREAGRSALRLAWQEAYECGEATIDHEHRELFALANGLIDVLADAGSSREPVLAALDALLAHVGRHFADEEAILARLGYADLEPHRRAHAGLLRRAGHLRERALAGEASLGAVVEFLAQDVVARHMLTVDRAFFPLFARAGAAPEPQGGSA